MAFQIVDCDNIRETFTGDLTAVVKLGGAAANSNAGSSKLANGDTSWWVVRAGAEFSEGVFTFNTGTPNTLTQTTVFKSSNGNAAVSFSSGAAGEAYIDLPGRVLDTLNLLENTVVSAATTDIGNAQGAIVAISGTTGPITSLGTAKNKLRVVRHSGSVIAHNATSLILKGGVNRTTVANAIGIYVSDNSGNWRELFYNDPSLGREILAAARTYYVRTDGSDSNNGLANTAGGAFLTVQKALDTIAGLDINSQAVTIQVATAGTYTGTIIANGPWLGSGTVTLIGDTSTPGNCILTQAGVGVSTVAAQAGGQLTIKGFKITSTGAGAGAGLKATSGGIISFQSIDFGACPRQIQSSSGGTVQWTGGSYNISAGAVYHWFASAGGSIIVEGATINTAGTPAFSGAFANISNLGIAFVDTNTFTGTGATGSRYAVVGNGVLYVSGAATTYLPGNAVGTTATGGQYL